MLYFQLSCKHTELMPRAVMALEKWTVLLKKKKSTMNKYISEELSLLLQNPKCVHNGDIVKAFYNYFKD